MQWLASRLNVVAILSLVILVVLSSLPLSSINISKSVSDLTRNSIEPAEVTVSIHRLLAEDAVDFGSGADWYYSIRVSSDGVHWQENLSRIPIITDEDDYTLSPDGVTGFVVGVEEVFVQIAVFDDDGTGFADADVADISSYSGYDDDNWDGSWDSIARGARFECIYNLTQDKIVSGDSHVFDSGYYKTSGSGDGSTSADEDDASVWFLISRTYGPRRVQVNINRIREQDLIDINYPDWYYVVDIDGKSITSQIFDPSSVDCEVPSYGRSNNFTTSSTSLSIKLNLLDDDAYSSDLAHDDVADISSVPGGGQDDLDGSYSYSDIWRNSTFEAEFYPLTGELCGDDFRMENGSFFTSGEMDGSIGVDENDAALYFSIYVSPPLIWGHSPTGTEVDTTNQAVRVIFSEPMNRSSVESSFSMIELSSGVSVGPFDFDWNYEDTALIVHPSSLDLERSYQVTVKNSAVSREGNHLNETLTWQFTTKANEAPVADAGTDQKCTLFEEVYLNATGSYDTTGEIRNFTWNFGDGSPASGVCVAHTYNRTGNYTVNLTIEDEYGLTAYDEVNVTVLLPSFIPSQLEYGGSRYWDFYNYNGTMQYSMNYSIAKDAKVDLHTLNNDWTKLLTAYLQRGEQHYVYTNLSLTDSNGLFWTNLNISTNETHSTWRNPANGLPVMEIIQHEEHRTGDSGGHHYDIFENWSSVDIVEPVFLQLSKDLGVEQSFNLTHFNSVSYSTYRLMDGRVVDNVGTVLRPPEHFTREHRVQILGQKTLSIAGQKISTYAIRDTYQGWGWNNKTLSPTNDDDEQTSYNNTIQWAPLNLEKAWYRSTYWFDSKEHVIPLKEYSEFYEIDGNGGPDFTRGHFDHSATVKHLWAVNPIYDGLNKNVIWSNFSAVSEIKPQWLQQEIKISENDTNDVYLGMELVFDTTVEHTGNISFIHNITEESGAKVVESSMLGSNDTIFTYIQPFLNLEIKFVSKSTGQIEKVFRIYRLPVPTTEDVDGDGSNITVGDYKIYLWDSPLNISSELNKQNLAGVWLLSNSSIRVGRIDILKVVEEYIKDPYIHSTALVIDELTDVYLDMNLNLNMSYSYLFGLHEELTNTTFETGDSAETMWFGFGDPEGNGAALNNMSKVMAPIGSASDLSLYGVFKSIFKTSLTGSLNLNITLFPSDSWWHIVGLKPRNLLNKPLAETTPVWGNCSVYSFAGSYSTYRAENPFSITLDEGWNLISLPLIQRNTSIDEVLESISGSWDYVMVYKANDSDHWKTNYVLRADQLSDLKVLTHYHAIWLHVNRSCTLDVFGLPPSNTSIPLYAGWNFVGYPTLEDNVTVAEAFAGTDYIRVEGFDPAALYGVSELSDDYILKPGEGYWVLVPADTIWFIYW